MRNGINNRLVALLAGALILGPSMAAAEGEMTSSMTALEARMMALEDKLAASEATIAAQREILGARVAPAPGALDSFLQDLEFGGHISASYVYNFNNPDQNVGNVAGGADHGTQFNYTFNTDHNTFSLDAVKLEIGKPASEPGDAGFQFDLLYGENATILEGLNVQAGPTNDRSSGSRDDDLEVFLQQAYVAYNASGVELKLGKFETLLGSEVLDSPENANITHSHLFNYAIPLWHTGLLASGGGMGEGISWSLGVVNGFNNDIDYNDNKGLLGQLAFEQEGYSLTYSSYIGSDGVRAQASNPLMTCATATSTSCVGDNNNRAQIHDLVARFEPSEELSIWSEFVYGRAETDNLATSHGPLTLAAGDEDPEWFAALLGFQYALSEKATIAVRGEWLRDDGGLLTGSTESSGVSAGLPSDEVDLYSGTVTLGYSVTDNLLARFEYRHDYVDADHSDISPFGESDRGFVPGFNGTNRDKDHQNVGLVEVSYIFD